MGGERGLFGQQRAEEGVAVDGHVQRLPDADVVQRRPGAVDADIGHFGVRIGEVGRRVGRVDEADRGHDVGLARRHHRRAHRVVGAEDIGRLGHRGRLAPVAVAAFEHDALARGPFGHRIGAGADRLAGEFHRRLGRHDGEAGEQQRRDRLRRIEGDVDGVGVDRLGRGLDAGEGLVADLALHLGVGGAGEGVDDVGGVEVGAVGERDALAQVQPPGAVALVGPALGEARLERAVGEVELHQRLGDVLQDDAADVRLRGHAGLDGFDSSFRPMTMSVSAAWSGPASAANAAPASRVRFIGWVPPGSAGSGPRRWSGVVRWLVWGWLSRSPAPRRRRRSPVRGSRSRSPGRPG